MNRSPSRARFEQVPLSSVPGLLQEKRRPQILNVSPDLLLLRTRTAILERAGVWTVNAGSTAEAVRLCRRYGFDGVVLCHELSEQAKRQVTQAARRRRAGTTVIGLYSIGPSEAAAADVAVNAHDGPEALLKAVRAILTTSGKNGR